MLRQSKVLSRLGAAAMRADSAGDAPMSIFGLLIGVLNCVLVAAVLVLLGAIVVWVAGLFSWPIPWDIQRIYLLIVLVIFIICVLSLAFGMPMVHLFGHAP
jgi:hypothetical protein